MDHKYIHFERLGQTFKSFDYKYLLKNLNGKHENNMNEIVAAKRPKKNFVEDNAFFQREREKGPAGFVTWNKLGFEVNPLEEVDGAIEVPRTCGVHD